VYFCEIAGKWVGEGGIAEVAPAVSMCEGAEEEVLVGRREFTACYRCETTGARIAGDAAGASRSVCRPPRGGLGVFQGLNDILAVVAVARVGGGFALRGCGLGGGFGLVGLVRGVFVVREWCREHGLVGGVGEEGCAASKL
jgi:hypothetical protein